MSFRKSTPTLRPAHKEGAPLHFSPREGRRVCCTGEGRGSYRYPSGKKGPSGIFAGQATWADGLLVPSRQTLTPGIRLSTRSMLPLSSPAWLHSASNAARLASEATDDIFHLAASCGGRFLLMRIRPRCITGSGAAKVSSRSEETPNARRAIADPRAYLSWSAFSSLQRTCVRSSTGPESPQSRRG
jgi:hypothetical protein